MGASIKTDNRFLEPKLKLRRHFLARYHATPPRVLDCCQGSGVLWKALLKEFPVEQYWGLDKKRRKGRLTIDSVRVLESGKWAADVLDVDTYGSPWSHWFHALRTGQGPLTVFLTVGLIRMGGGGMMSKPVLQALRLSGIKRAIPPSLLGKLHDFSVDYCLRQSLAMGWTIIEAQEAFPSDKARYLGLRLEKTKSP